MNMATQSGMRATGREGSILATTVILLAIASVIVGSVLTANLNYTRNSERTYFYEKAAFLADAGMQSAIVKLNAFSDADITYNQSRTYFTSTNTMAAGDWGFETQLIVTNSQQVVVSTGRYNGQTVQVQAGVTLGVGSRNIHAMYAHAVFAGNSSGDTNYILKIGGSSGNADFVFGDTYSGGDAELSGAATLRLPEVLIDYNSDGICGPTDKWNNAFAVQVWTNQPIRSEYDAYTNSMRSYFGKFYNNGTYDYGEPYVDTIGNGVYDVGEPFTDSNGNGVRDAGDAFIDRNGNGVYNAGVDTVVDNGNGRYDAGEQWTEDTTRKIGTKKVRVNGQWDKLGGYWNNTGTTWTSNTTTKSWPAEAFEDVGDGSYQAAEAYVDQNGYYDSGETYFDDRNSVYDYGTEAHGRITGMPSPGPGQVAATGYDPLLSPPDLAHMYYSQDRSGTEPVDALPRWGNDVAVTASDYGTAKAVTDQARPEHIFVRNPLTSGSSSVNGKTISGRSYTALYDTSTNRIDDYFFEDPTDASYNSSVSGSNIALNDSGRTASMYVTVRPEANMDLYYVDGNVYIHHPSAYSLRFRTPGTRITIVAKGNITVSDEFYYNASYPANLQYTNMNSTIVDNPSDVLCLIALKNPNCANSGNVYIGDAQFGTGGSIHAMLYAENDFVDNNLNSVDQQYISIFGNMTAGDQVRVNRPTGAGQYRTRLDVTLDERIRNGTVIVPGLPHPVGSQRSVYLDTAWRTVAGTWKGWTGF